MTPHRLLPLVMMLGLAPAGALAATTYGTCNLDVSSSSASCGETGQQCACITVTNICPYPVVFQWRMEGDQKARSHKLETVARDEPCADRPGQKIHFLGWQPEEGHPKPGEDFPANRSRDLPSDLAP